VGWPLSGRRGEAGRRALHAGRVGAREDQEVLVVAAHPGGEVVELEEPGQPLGVLLDALDGIEPAVIEKDNLLISAPLLSLLMSARRPEVALEQDEQESTEPALTAIRCRVSLFLQQISEETLREILCVVPVIASLADKTVERRPVILAKLR